MNRKRAVACLSSGLDSAMALRLGQTRGYLIDLSVTFDYGQKAFASEVRQAKLQSDFFQIPHRVIALPWFREMQSGGSLLKNDSQLPSLRADQLDEMAATQASAKAVWVPNRNGVMIEIAAGIAEDSGANAVIVGFNREEAATFPDNSEAYLQALNQALSFSTSGQVEVISPTSALNKQEIVAIGRKLNFPFHLLWSCYLSGEKMCGKCESCLRLMRALNANEVISDGLFSNQNP